MSSLRNRGYVPINSSWPTSPSDIEKSTISSIAHTIIAENMSTFTTGSSSFDNTTTVMSPTPASIFSSLKNEDIRDYFVLFLYLITAIVAIIGNFFVCWVIYKTPKLRSTTYYLLFNMAVSDLIAGVVIPAQWLLCAHHLLENFSYMARICAITKGFQILSYYLSTYSMLFVAIDRFMLVRYPASQGLHRKWIPLSLSWLVGLAFSATTVVNMRISEYFSPKSLMSCRIVFATSDPKSFRYVRIIVYLASQYVLPLLSICVLYYFVWKTIRERDVIGSKTESNVKKMSNAKKKLIKMLVIVVAVFALAWLPVHCIHFINFFVYPLLPKGCNSTTFYMFTYWLAISSCCYNPFIYYWGNPEFRGSFLSVWARIRGAYRFLKCQRIKFFSSPIKKQF